MRQAKKSEDVKEATFLGANVKMEVYSTYPISIARADFVKHPKRASRPIKDMAAEARREHERGETEQF
ncbi:MAG: hypothetical protein QOJ65_721 [Fimbriimonadaceae bacterium]|jgi:hypothetical protein|nr:hypothetical protein [Fimbriimonadaceae bacterium]